jgi:hypothetical protein
VKALALLVVGAFLIAGLFAQRCPISQQVELES